MFRIPFQLPEKVLLLLLIARSISSKQFARQGVDLIGMLGDPAFAGQPAITRLLWLLCACRQRPESGHAH